MRRAFLVPLVVLCGVSTPHARGADVHGIALVGGKPAPNAVVWVEAPNAPKEPGPRPVLDQRNLDFFPRVLVVRVGTAVAFPNHDRVFHNVFSFHDGKQLDLGVYPTGTVKHVTFDKPGLSRLFCNIHPQMSAYIMTVDTPYFAVSDANGSFTIAGLRPGTHTYRAWRPGAVEITGSWTVESSRSLEVRWP